ncbi:peptidase M41 family protein [Salmonella enterica]|nr:peptidase M41 family protein [Salmonella enterica]ECI2368011.1 peptidase M41 family protein [Salmonella enterica subsp. enterica serovar Muenchen]ECM7483104.1 peptidase M41 family protein [Salmonella enterica subsp. enterica serovar Muenchen]EDB6855986.1 peptidase M41 family protein [Salmonella enterica subsp. enterica serovar Muenchen]EDB6870301.1 peptidase M41 family protein [Salmonella enterica subsp. enterica serovar Muenchen]
MGATHQISEQGMFYNWIGNGKRCVAFHEAGHAIAAWLIRLDIQVIAVMDESGYVAGEHVHEAQCLGVVKHSIIHSHDLGCLLESKSGVVGRDGKVIPFLHYFADGIKRDAIKAAFVALAGPVSEAIYENDDVFNKKYSRPHRYDMANVKDMLDLICATDDRINRELMLSDLVEKTKSLIAQYWPEVEKIAHVLERDSVVNGRTINSIIGVNFVDRATPFFELELINDMASMGFN